MKTMKDIMLQMTPKYQKTFVDTLRIHVRGGAGGMGCPKYGGIGGKGGDVIVETTKDTTLLKLMKKYPKKIIKAANGENSHQKCILARPGEDKVIEVPKGVNIVDHNYRILGELNEVGNRMIVAKGGPGGCKETGFSGLKGQELYIRLELKLIADIGLVGFPNAGKSTLLRAITNAHPKIASYPFTTIKPNVGIIKFDDLRSISMADLPGLIEGAHKNIGLGHQFLRHCERTKLLLLIVDIQGFQLSYKHKARTCLETVILLNKEIELYRNFLLDKPAILIVNKMDTAGAWDIYKSIETSLRNLEEATSQCPNEIRPLRVMKFDEVIPISAKTSPEDVNNLKNTLRNYLDLLDEEQMEDAEENLLESLKGELKESGPILV